MLAGLFVGGAGSAPAIVSIAVILLDSGSKLNAAVVELMADLITAKVEKEWGI